MRSALITGVLIAVAAFVCGCGSQRSSPPLRASLGSPGAPGAPGSRGPAFGLTEDNADLLWAPGSAPPSDGAFGQARHALAALHPSYLRLLVDWAALQPRPDRRPELEARIDGCARGVSPCGPYAGIRAELAAIASQQRAAGAGEEGFRVVLDLFGTPSWAARPPSGCELPGASAFARPLRPEALTAYRALIHALLALAQAQGVALEWWSPWNEPNDPRFISPQRSSCASASHSLAPAIYGQLAEAMAAELRADGGTHHLLLGELNDLEADSPRSTSVAEFVAELPNDVLCLAGVWSIHAYARYGAAGPENAVGALESALDARGGCARGAAIWVTEAGAGAPHPGQQRGRGAAEEQAGCQALQRQLLGWYGDPRVQAVFQYTFREDPYFPVGLTSADLSHLYPTYGLWLAWSRLRGTGLPPPAKSVCAQEGAGA